MLLCKCMWIFTAEIDFFFDRNIDNTAFCFLREPDWSSEHSVGGFFSCLILGSEGISVYCEKRCLETY